jgi:hypothetical protein
MRDACLPVKASFVFMSLNLWTCGPTCQCFPINFEYLVEYIIAMTKSCNLLPFDQYNKFLRLSDIELKYMTYFNVKGHLDESGL